MRLRGLGVSVPGYYSEGSGSNADPDSGRAANPAVHLPFRTGL